MTRVLKIVGLLLALMFIFWLVEAFLLMKPQPIALAQEQEKVSLCPSAATGTPEPEWFEGAVRPWDRARPKGMTNPQLVKSSKPEYPPEAKAAQITGEVWLDARVDIDGRVRNACVVRSLLPELDAEAVKAAKKFEFRPGQLDGVTAPVIVRIQIAFNPR